MRIEFVYSNVTTGNVKPALEIRAAPLAVQAWKHAAQWLGRTLAGSTRGGFQVAVGGGLDDIGRNIGFITGSQGA